MAKDPAFLFYPGDWLGGTMAMTFEEKGAYMELLMLQFNRGPFSEQMARAVLRENPSLWDTIKVKFSTTEHGEFYNQRLQDEKEKREKFTESRRQSRKKADEDNVRIYIVRNNVRSTYKIGSSVNPVRRYNELTNQQSPAIMDSNERDLTLIWYSDPLPRKEESVLHKHFSDKSITGEWFHLIEDDLQYIYTKYTGTFYRTSPRTSPRTMHRTENENGNENIIEDWNTWGTSILKKEDAGWEKMRGREITAEELKEFLSVAVRRNWKMETQQQFRVALNGFKSLSPDKSQAKTRYKLH